MLLETPDHLAAQAVACACPRVSEHSRGRSLPAAILARPVIATPLLRFASFASVERVAAGERIWAAGDRARHLTFIADGIVAIEQTAANGDGVVLGLFGAADGIGLSDTLHGVTYAADAIALGDSVSVLRIAAEPVLRALPRCAGLARAVNQALLQQTAVLRAKIDIVSAGTVPRRLATLFAHLAGRFGAQTADGSIRIDVGLTREQIAQFVSARVETVIRILSRWQKAGWLVCGRFGVEIRRPDMLKRILGS